MASLYRFHISVLLMLLSLSLMYAPRPGWAKAASGQTVPACTRLRFLSAYQQAGLIERKPDGTIVLRLDADLHSADCGAPDCYGTKLILTMKPVVAGPRCVIRDVQVRARDYSGAGCGAARPVNKAQQARYTPQSGQADLNDVSLDKLTLRSNDRSHAIVLLKNNFFYFDRVTAEGVLRTRLQPEDAADAKCCWGATSSHLQHIRK